MMRLSQKEVPGTCHVGRAGLKHQSFHSSAETGLKRADQSGRRRLVDP